MKLIKKLARKLLFSRKKQSPTPVFQTKPTTSANSVAEPVIKFEQPKVGGSDLDDKKPASDTETCLDKKPATKKPGRPKGQTSNSAKKPSAKKPATAKQNVQKNQNKNK